METGCWGVRLMCSSCADVTSPDSARKARTPAEEEEVGEPESSSGVNQDASMATVRSEPTKAAKTLLRIEFL